jgi:putative ABC transport system ATP-binding protein
VSLLDCTNLVRNYATQPGAVAGLAGVSLQVEAGEFVVLQGASGSGKSTLLLTLGGMLHPTSGRVVIASQDLYALSNAARARFRAERLGFVFQLFHLVPYLNVRQNVLAGLLRPTASDRQRAEQLLVELGLQDRLEARPATLSAGERQRVALARALLKQPTLILADEPTGNLDPANTALVFHRLEAYRRQGGTVLVVTHGTQANAFASRILRLDAGRLVSTASAPTLPTFPPTPSPAHALP